jgi:hypothetical protein
MLSDFRVGAGTADAVSKTRSKTEPVHPIPRRHDQHLHTTCCDTTQCAQAISADCVVLHA